MRRAKASSELGRLGRRPRMRHHVHHVARPHRQMEVQGGKTVGPAGGFGEHRGQQRRGVGREDRAGRTERVELGEHTALQRGVFRHRLTDEVNLCRRESRVGGGRDSGQRAVTHPGIDDARLDLIVGVAAEPSHPRLQGGRVDVVQDDAVAVGGALEPDLQAHRAAADDEHPPHVVDVHACQPPRVRPAQGRAHGAA